MRNTEIALQNGREGLAVLILFTPLSQSIGQTCIQFATIEILQRGIEVTMVLIVREMQLF